MNLTANAIFFRSAAGGMFVYGDDLGRPLLFSPDGSRFYELHNAALAGNSKDHYLFFEDPHHGTCGKIQYLEDELVLNGVKYYRVDSPVCIEIEIVPLPTIRQIEYLFVLPDGQYLCVSSDKYNFSYKSFKLFVGPCDAMRQIPIESVTRYHDGAMYIRTGEGLLLLPSSLTKGARATWKDAIELAEVDPKQFKIVEGDIFELQAV